MNNPNYPAYPSPNFTHPNGEVYWGNIGLTIRQEFVKAAMTGLCANPVLMDHLDHIAEWTALQANAIADATLAEEERTRKP